MRVPKMNLLCQRFRKLEHYKQTDETEHYHATFSGVTGGGTAPGDTLQGLTPDLKFIFFVAEFRKKTG